ncbi:elongation factor P hydroxylase [Marinomonas sp. THO17]|uniref:elongation factor P hydroxylase n=1 Tax=Marinomonas sp. THO17 TaxID=3149048 RepID=UPI00336BEF41
MALVDQIVLAFNQCFLHSYQTCLVGNSDEPLYLPAKDDQPAKILFRLDYASSALHEVSHWCIAGAKRRQLEDYGYWYETDSRNLTQQAEFEQVEVKPQAVECILHWSAGMPFNVSVDNLAYPDYDASPFRKAVMQQVESYIENKNLPYRAEIYARFLLAKRHPDVDFNEFLKHEYENRC